ncbi:MAG TPA: four helix bundle protein [Patescibacteria group bacterium]|nr:four helix bundle protein [Patescibacteria group bacterium]
MEGKYVQLRDVNAYIISFQLSNYVWEVVIGWDYFSKDTVGKQFVRSTDSISANIAEGFGRYGKSDKIKFYRYSYASLKESFDWNEKAKRRTLITSEQYENIIHYLQQLPKEINGLIKLTNQKLKK